MLDWVVTVVMAVVLALFLCVLSAAIYRDALRRRALTERTEAALKLMEQTFPPGWTDELETKEERDA